MVVYVKLIIMLYTSKAKQKFCNKLKGLCRLPEKENKKARIMASAK